MVSICTIEWDLNVTFYFFENLQQLFPLFVSIILKYKDTIWPLIKVLFPQGVRSGH